MIRTGRVIQAEENTLTVCFSRMEACDTCNLCGNGRDDTTVSIKGQAEVGDRVEVEMPEAQVLKVSVITYAIPLASLLLGLWLGTLVFPGREGAVLISALLFLGIGLMAVKLLDRTLGRKSHWQPKLIAVLPKEDTET